MDFAVCVLVFVNRITCCFFFFSSRRRHTRCYRDWSSDVCSSDLYMRLFHVAPGKGQCVAPVAQCGELDLFRPTSVRPGFAALEGEQASAEPKGVKERSEERRVGKECRDGGETGHRKISRCTRRTR